MMMMIHVYDDDDNNEDNDDHDHGDNDNDGDDKVMMMMKIMIDMHTVTTNYDCTGVYNYLLKMYGTPIYYIAISVFQVLCFVKMIYPNWEQM